MPLILGTNSIKDTGYDVANSLRFNNDSSDNLSRTPSSTSNRRTFTFSTWFKLSGTDGALISAGTDISNGPLFIIDMLSGSNIGTLRVEDTVGGNNVINLRPTRKLRDTSWYHLCVAIDTTQGTASNRVKLYINGTQETSFGTADYPNQNLELSMNQNHITRIGTRATSPSGKYFDGYMCETVLVDGSQLAPDQFGEFDSDSGIWKPIDVSGLTFGTNGFYLDFEDSSALGNDAAGSNNWTANNLTSVDQSLDTCTNNACTWNPLRFWNRSGTLQKVSFDNGNLRAIFDDNGYNEYAFASIGVDTGKWFCEMKAEDITATANTRIGVLNMDYTGTGNPGDQSTSVSYMADGQKRVGGSNSSYGASYTNGDIIGVALDVTNNTVTFYKNGASQGAISITANTLYTFYSEDYASSGNKEISANFSSPAYAVSSGNSDANGYGNFEYAVPSGYFALNTKNLAENS